MTDVTTKLTRTLCALALLAALAAAPALASEVTPIFIPGNPTCVSLGYDYGFKPQPEPPPSGTYTFPGTSETVTIASDGTYFDWSSTLGVDAVLAKGGPNANAYLYEPPAESFGDTGLHSPINPNTGEPYGLSHIEICYDFEVAVAKSATTSYSRTWQWTIDKSVAPAAWTMFAGDSGTSLYTVAVTRTGYTDSGWSVAGEITVHNPAPFDATVEAVADVISGGIAAPVDCGVSFPYTLASGETLACTYQSALPDGSARVNTATVTTSGTVGGGAGTADVLFGAPTTEVNTTVDVVDTNGASWQFADRGAVGYLRTFACDGDEGSHGNVATIVQTGQSDDATVSVSCVEIEVDKSADPPTLTRTWEWAIAKDADQTELLLTPGQSFVVNYTVTLTASSEDSEWHATGEIHVSNPTALPAHVASVTDSMPGAGVIVPDCGGAVPGFLAPGGALTCTWEADLDSGESRTNTAQVARTNFSYDAAGTPTVIGATTLAATALVDFSTVVVSEIDECVSVADAFDGEAPVELGTACADESPKSFEYSVTLEYQEPDDCGTFDEHNVATFNAGDTGATGSDDHTVTVTVACENGCTLTPGYWKTHSQRGPAPYDDAWQLIGPQQEATPFFLSGASWYDVLWTPPQGNAYYILAHAWIAAKLNVLDGAAAGDDVLDALAEGQGLFETYAPSQIERRGGVRRRMLELAGLLDMYNNGLIGPGHCSEDTSSPR